jgi:hypothetical protein
VTITPAGTRTQSARLPGPTPGSRRTSSDPGFLHIPERHPGVEEAHARLWAICAQATSTMLLEQVPRGACRIPAETTCASSNCQVNRRLRNRLQDGCSTFSGSS